MKKNTKFSARKLKSARSYRGKTLDQLAKDSGINKKDLKAFEDEKYVPNLENEMKLANVLQFPREYFLTEYKYNVVNEGNHFNGNSKAFKNDEIASKEKAMIVHRIYKYIEGFVMYPKPNLPKDINKNLDAEEMAIKVREFYELGEKPIQDLVSFLESKGAIVLGNNMNKKGALPFTQRQKIDKEHRYIVSIGNDKKSAARRSYDLAIEFAYIIATELNITNKDFMYEDFAAAFLLPKEGFLEDLQNPSDLESYIELKGKWIAPISLMVYRAFQLGRLSYKKYNFLIEEMKKMKWLENEPLDNIKAINPQILKMGIDIIVENKLLNKNQILDGFKQVGIDMYSNDLEELIGLKEGFFGSNNKGAKGAKVIDFKKKKK